MRKFFVYILILTFVLTSGVLSVAGNASAVDPLLGDCYIYYGHALPAPYSETKTGLKKTDCDKYINKSGGVTATWFQGSTAGATWRCYDGSGYTTNDSETACAQKNFSWAFGKIKNPTCAAPSVIKNGVCVCEAPNVLKDNKCISPDTGTGTSSDSSPQNTTYKLLSPLPCPPESTDCTVGPGGEKLLENYTIADTNPLSKYLNIMLKIFIGICAILAMIMITLGGLEYMTSELPGNKESGKNKITQAILGLLLALGAWLILWTINPDLLVSDLTSLAKVEVTVDLMDDTETITEAYTQSAAPTTTVAGCSGKIVRVLGGPAVCDSIASKLEAMMLAAKKDNLELGGYGYRDAGNQKQKRIKFCGGNFTDRNAKCNPPTALPGASRHNAGLAVDFRCNRQSMDTRSGPCFKWLQTNASKYGFYNLPSEPWHWSIDGR